MKKVFFFLKLIVLCSCVGGGKQTYNSSQPLDSLQIKYAEGFRVYYHDGYKELLVLNPWVENEIQQRLYLVHDLNVQTPSDGYKLQIPIQSIAISSSTHTEFLQLLDEINTITGLCTPHLIYNNNIRQRYAEGKITSLGDAHNVNIEQLVHLAPNVYLVSSYNQQDEQAKRLLQNGVNVVFNNEWTEKTLLARAEWIKFVASFYGKEQFADSLFSQIEQDYLAASAIARAVTDKPTIMVGGNFKGTWYVPSGNSYMGRLFFDAGANYFFQNDSSTSVSIALNFETVLNNFHDADVWLNAPTTTLSSLLQMDSRHNLFRSAQEGRVFGFHARILPEGANDFWESAVARPNLVLKDIIWALHPNLIPEYQPTYILKLN